MIDNILKLEKEFERIKNKGYVMATRGGSTGIGKTFEDLIGKKEDQESNPDYLGIEIKTKRSYSKAYTTLFNMILEGRDEVSKYLKDNYGYPDMILKNKKVLQVSVWANEPNLIANKYLFKLKVDKVKRKIYLVIYDKNLEVLESQLFWDMDKLKQRLENKLTYLAFVKAWPNKINGVNYYKYYKLEIYRLTNFDNFINLLDKGIIRVTFKIGVFRRGSRIGEVHDRGTSFEIKEEDLDKLFIKLR